MALIMSGIMAFITAWPIAVIATQVVTPVAFKLTFMVAPPPQQNA